MDARRQLTACGLALLIPACASGPPAADFVATAPVEAVAVAAPMPRALPPLPATARPYLASAPGAGAVAADPMPEADTAEATVPTRSGRPAIALANARARAASRSDRFIGGVQRFAWEEGRIYEVWAAPLRVTTLTLAPGETVLSKAAGDTVRWQIGETTSGSGAEARAHVILKPLERGLETNLVLTTSRRVYWLELKSGSAEAYNAAVAWDVPADTTAGSPAPQPPADAVSSRGPADRLDAAYRIVPSGRAPDWTPTAVFNDGVRTFITFPARIEAGEMPALFVLDADGQSRLVNYRQQGGMLIVDRLFDRAELRSSDRRPRRVRLERLAGDRP